MRTPASPEVHVTSPAARPDRIAIAAALVTVGLWASAFVGIRAAAVDLSPGSIALGRLAIGSVALGALVAVRGWRRPSRRDLLLIVASGLTWFAAYNLALNTAERLIDAGTTSMLVNVGPILIAILAGVFLREGFPPRLFAGCVVAFAGAVVIGLATTGSTSATVGGAAANAPLGIVLCLVAALAYASGVTLQKPALRNVSALQVTWLACLTGFVVCLPFAPTLVSEVGRAQPSSLAWLVYLGLFPTSVAFTTWAFALGRSSAGRLGSLTYLVPPVAIGLAAVLLDEAPAALALVGGAIAIGGVIVARSKGDLGATRLRSALAR
jgi:drug/metabolite transporter (DMT)-like permease